MLMHVNDVYCYTVGEYIFFYYTSLSMPICVHENEYAHFYEALNPVKGEHLALWHSKQRHCLPHPHPHYPHTQSHKLIRTHQANF